MTNLPGSTNGLQDVLDKTGFAVRKSQWALKGIVISLLSKIARLKSYQINVTPNFQYYEIQRVNLGYILRIESLHIIRISIERWLLKFRGIIMESDRQEKKTGHPIEGLMKTAMVSIKEMVDVNTVVGEAVETNDGTVIIPVNSSMAAALQPAGANWLLLITTLKICPTQVVVVQVCSVKPVGFLVVRMNDVRLISVAGNQLAERIVDVAPQLIDKLENVFKESII